MWAEENGNEGAEAMAMLINNNADLNLQDEVQQDHFPPSTFISQAP